MKDRLTYRHLWQLLGLTVTAIVGYLWAFDKPIPIHGLEDKHEPVAYLLATLGGLTFFLISTFVPKLVSDKPIWAKTDDTSLTETQRERNRKAMLDLVEKIWITGFLENVLNEMRSLNLDMSFADPEKVLRKPGMSDYTLPDSHAIAQAYYDLNRRLVILGEPGSGKTVTLLQLARQLIIEARSDAKKPIPVVLALSSWATEQLPFEDWLCKEIHEKYGFQRRAADALVKSEQLTYFLDGLDEVAEDYRETCLQAIKEFAEKRRPIDYAVACRKVEFQELITRLNVTGEIVINPLTRSQIDEYLKDETFDGLRRLKTQNRIVQDFAEIPFMLNTMAVVTRKKSERDIISEMDFYATNHSVEVNPAFYEDAALLRDYFLDTYVNLRLRHPDHKKYSDVQKTRIHLKWLAGQLVKHDQTDLYIELMQPSWLDTSVFRRYFRWSTRVATGLLLGLLGSLFLGLLVGMHNGVMFGLSVGLLSSLLVGFPASQMENAIRPIESLQWRKQGLWYGFLGGLAGLIAGDLLGSLFLGLLCGLLGGLYRRATIPFRTTPNSGIKYSLINCLLIALLLALSVGLPYSILFGLPLGLLVGMLGGVLFGLPVGLLFGLIFGGAAVIQHSVLRYFLWREGHIPLWRYDKFLDYMAELVILRKVGGGYRFVHDYLRQYLASAAFVPDPMQKTE